MSIIGILANKKQADDIKMEIEKHNINAEVININYVSIENILKIKFDIIVIQDSPDKLNEKQKYLEQVLNNCKYLLLNTDISINKSILNNINIKILTYGLKTKATVTVSSLEDKKVVVSIQRGFKSFNGNIIEQQEIPTELVKKGTINLYNCLIKICIIYIITTKNG